LNAMAKPLCDGALAADLSLFRRLFGVPSHRSAVGLDISEVATRKPCWMGEDSDPISRPLMLSCQDVPRGQLSDRIQKAIHFLPLCSYDQPSFTTVTIAPRSILLSRSLSAGTCLVRLFLRLLSPLSNIQRWMEWPNHASLFYALCNQ
jgi:hypothetical protein